MTPVDDPNRSDGGDSILPSDGDLHAFGQEAMHIPVRGRWRHDATVDAQLVDRLVQCALGQACVQVPECGSQPVRQEHLALSLTSERVDALALQNCYEYNYQPAPGQVVALLNLGASVMNINIVKGTTPLFPRDVSVGGHQYTDSLQKELDLSFEDAEALKLGRKVGTVSEDAKQPILQQVTEIIVLEIQKTFDFFRASAAGEHIEKIYLAGGSSKVPGLVEALRQEFSMPVELLNPFQRVVPPTEGLGAELVEQNPGQMAVAVGLALRSFESL